MLGTGFDFGTVAGEAGWTSRKLTAVLVAACAVNALLLGLLVTDFGLRQGQTIAQQKVPSAAAAVIQRQ